MKKSKNIILYLIVFYVLVLLFIFIGAFSEMVIIGSIILFFLFLAVFLIERNKSHLRKHIIKFLPKYTEFYSFSIAIVIIFSIFYDENIRQFLLNLYYFENFDIVIFIIFIFFVIGVIISIFNFFVKRKKTEIEKFFIGFFLIMFNLFFQFFNLQTYTGIFYFMISIFNFLYNLLILLFLRIDVIDFPDLFIDDDVDIRFAIIYTVFLGVIFILMNYFLVRKEKIYILLNFIIILFSEIYRIMNNTTSYRKKKNKKT